MSRGRIVYLFVTGVCAVVTSAAHKYDSEITSKCARETNLDKDDYLSMIEAFDIGEPLYSAQLNNSTMCYLKCVLEGAGLMDEQGKVSEKIYALVKGPRHEKRLERCLVAGYRMRLRTEMDPCEATYHMATCAADTMDTGDCAGHPFVMDC